MKYQIKTMESNNEIMTLLMKQKLKAQKELTNWNAEDIQKKYVPFAHLLKYLDDVSAENRHRFLVIYGQFFVFQFMTMYLNFFNQSIKKEIGGNLPDWVEIISKDNKSSIIDVDKKIPKEIIWMYNEFLVKYEEIIENLLIREFQDILRLNRIGENTIKRVKQNVESVSWIIELFYQYYDKLKANNFIKHDFRSYKAMLEFYKEAQGHNDRNVCRNVFSININNDTVIRREELMTVTRNIEELYKKKGEKTCLKKSYI